MNIHLIAAVTADGFIAKSSTHMADWTSKEDKQLFVALTKQAGVMVMGSRTYDTIGRPLPGRKTVIYTTHPEKYTDEALIPTQQDPKDLLRSLKDQGYTDVTICGGSHIYDLFMNANLVTDVHLTIEPLMFGAGVPLFSNPLTTELTLVDSTQLNANSLALHYRVNNPVLL